MTGIADETSAPGVDRGAALSPIDDLRASAAYRAAAATKLVRRVVTEALACSPSR